MTREKVEQLSRDEVRSALRQELDARLRAAPHYGIKGGHATLVYLADRYLRLEAKQ